MKRCPECKFIYLDTDENCDLDGSKLFSVTDAEIESETNGSRSQIEQTNAAASFISSRRALLLALAGALTIAFALLFLYAARTRRDNSGNSFAQQSTNQGPQIAKTSEQPSPVATPTSEAIVLTGPSDIANNRGIDSSKTQLRRATSSNPVSTTSNDKSKLGKVIITLSNGATIEADEAWRTKDGVWYRRSGLVTLLKGNSVRSIERKR